MITIREVLDFILMALIVGYIFSDFFRRDYKGTFDTKAILFAAGITAPAIILHELAHKFVAIHYGLQATFHAAYPWLAVGLILKALNTGFIFFVPAYVSLTGLSTPLTQSKVAVAGPLMNLALYLISFAVLKLNLVKNKNWLLFTVITKKINGFLFILNMIPIPGFDGYHFFSGIFKTYF
ncbi:hypothetical protein KY308_00060 [Candidatus Woesearchaeota archaeon]|nr:hypothetical protein [Candidatus Woesearchaeota archaeon]